MGKVHPGNFYVVVVVVVVVFVFVFVDDVIVTGNEILLLYSREGGIFGRYN